MVLRADGTFAPGTFAGGPKLRDALSACFTFDDDIERVADILDLGADHLRRVFDGSAPLPVMARYTRLAETLWVVDEHLDLRLLYTWQRDDNRDSGKQKKVATGDR